ncbi:uncharacterized protein LOC129593505 [Paramacrobiotus metropolitanus]|uniref:uncharacterized protein LOC129593505 n=1 Tax=Paramacrobiotus metropolitanus TaxID=2943436 RepID=UPI0024464391|nr:uncharacterized protein LOC129593505 [Paramacrobiotus metropolitanus]
MEQRLVVALMLLFMDITFCQPVPEPMPRSAVPVDDPSLESQNDMTETDDPCSERHNVQPGETCNNIAALHGLKVDQLVLLNPGMACRPFFSGMNLCVDQRALDAIMSDATNSQGFRMLSREEMDYNIANADSAAVQGDISETAGYGYT